jgi:hypothetical protein
LTAWISWDDAQMPSEADAAQDLVILASFENRHAAEHMLASLKGAKGAVQEVRERESHVGSDERAVHALLARVGPDAALVLVCCDDQETRVG